MKTLISILLLCVLTFRTGHAQGIETLPDFSVVEDNMPYDDDSEYSTEELEELYSDLLLSPVDINDASPETLMQFPFLSTAQIDSLQSYIDRNGPLLSVNELMLVGGFDWRTCAMLRPFVCAGGNANAGVKAATLADRFKYGRSELTVTGGYSFPKRKGYASAPDSAKRQAPGSYFLGGPLYNSVKYRYGYKDNMSIGIVAEKDAGEPFFKGRNKYGYDFYSLHFYLKDIGFVKSLAAGDYKLSFGRGLVVNNSLFMGKSIYSASVQTRPAAIRKHFSSDEYNFFRGLAATMGNENVEVSLWLSRKKADATTEGSIMTALKKDGRHRTQLDMQKKHAVTANAAGANITFRKDFFKIGLTAMYASFDKELKPDIRKYNMFYPQGKDFFNISADYDFLWQGIYFSGETALDKHMNIATVNMINMSPAEGFRLFLLHRYYSRKYASLYANAFSSGSMPNNEHGLFASMELQPLPRLSLYLSGDFYIFPWIKYSANKLKTKGTDITAKADWMIRNSLMLTADYRFRHGEKNRTTDGERSVRPYHSHLAKLKLSYSHSCGLAFGSVVAYRRVSKPSTEKYNGFLFMQSVVWQVPSLPLELCANYGQFDTDDYEARIYSYESSFIRSLYSPALYGDGTRLSCSARFTFKDRCAIAFRYSHLLFNGEKSLGSGADMIDGNKRDELNISMKFRF